MKVLIVTPLYKQIGHAVLSWANAFRYTMDARPDIQFQHSIFYGTPPEAVGATPNHIILAKYRAALDAACTGGTGRVALDGPAVIAAWQAIGGKGKPTYKALEALAA